MSLAHVGTAKQALTEAEIEFTVVEVDLLEGKHYHIVVKKRSATHGMYLTKSM